MDLRTCTAIYYLNVHDIAAMENPNQFRKGW